MSKVENLASIIDRFGPHLHDEPYGGWSADRHIDKMVPTHCPYCGMQCGMNLLVEKNHVIGVEPRYDFPVNEGRLCPKGIFVPPRISHYREESRHINRSQMAGVGGLRQLLRCMPTSPVAPDSSDASGSNCDD